MSSKKNDAPLYQKVKEYAQGDRVRFHVPGHKGGLTFWEEAYETYRDILAIDVTELTGLDDLHHPQGVIAEAEQLAANCFFADYTYFLVGGSTVGNLAMILAHLKKGDQVLVQRNCHKSIFHALALAEVEAVFLTPQINSLFQTPTGIDCHDLQAALHLYPNCQALILTYPSYYGEASQLTSMIQMAHEQNLLVLVDEAHGAHFGQSRSLPPSAMQLGADCSVQSTHKMLTSMTMTSMLHLQGNRVDKEEVEYYLHALQSSSPSYPLLASLDAARAQVETMKEEDWEDSLRQVKELRQDILKLSFYHLLGGKGGDDCKQYDPFKLVLQPKGKMSGFQLQAELEKYQIFAELADPLNVLLTLPLKLNSTWNEQLVEALKQIAVQFPHEEEQDREEILDTRFGSAKEVSMANAKKVKMKHYRKEERRVIGWQESADHYAAEMLTPYPPGIPILVPGERITAEIIQQIKLLQKEGAYFQGKRAYFETIQVLK